MTALLDRIRTWDRSLDEPVDVRALAVLRLAIGPIVLLHLRPFLSASLDGAIYSDSFSLPFWTWLPELPRVGYVAMLWITAGSALLLSVGLLSRTAAWMTAGGVTYNVLLSQTHFHHNRAFLIILLIGLAVLPTGRTVSVDALLARRRGRPLDPVGSSRLALTVLRIEIATVYLASGFSKLIDADWWGGTVTRLRIEQHRTELAGVFPDGIIDLLSSSGFQAVAAKAVVLTELFIGAGLLIRRTRKAAIWVAIPFHVSIQFAAAVQTFSIAALAALVVWVDRPSHDRVITADRRWGVAIRALDWTGRFRIVPGSGSLELDEGGMKRRGRSAGWFSLSRLPVTFWFAAPIQLLRRG